MPIVTRLDLSVPIPMVDAYSKSANTWDAPSNWATDSDQTHTRQVTIGHILNAMPMRTDCKHYESRSYSNGDAVRKCRLDLAPEAPWRCPADCESFAKRLVDVGWSYGSLAETLQTPPPEVEMTEDVAALLDSAEDIVNAAGLDLLAEMDAKAKKRSFRKKKKRR